MRKVVLAMFMSLDGYINRPGGNLRGPAYSADLQKHWIDRNMERAGTMMYGRVAYEGMVSYWTSPQAQGPQATQLADMDKLVFSRTLEQADWGRVTIIRDDIAAEIEKRRAGDGKDMVLIAGANIAETFIKLGLIDELSLLVLPVLFGGGTRLFAEGLEQTSLKLAEALTFDTGVVRLTYVKG